MSASPSTEVDVEQKLFDEIAACSKDPLRFVLLAFDWGNGELKDHDGPDVWQRDLLNEIKAGLPFNEAIRIAMASGHGPGKSAFVAWLILWAISTKVDTRGVVTANTATQLKTKTWAELAKWHRLCICGYWFELTATAIYAKDPKHEKTWRVDSIPWSENSTEAFAGLHNQGKRIIVLFDEGSAIPDVIYEVTEGALTDKNTEIIWGVFGNPTRNTGRFRECFAGGRFHHRWKAKQIDSRDAKLTNKAEIAEWVSDYGEDSDFVRVRVRGVFPRAGSTQFISGDLVQAAASPDRDPEVTLYDPLVMGVDVARFGDDKTVFRFRRGRDARSIKPIKYRGLDTMQVAARVAEAYEKYKPDAIFIDNGSFGAGVVDRCNYLKLPVLGIDFGGEPDGDIQGREGKIAYYNKRAEMWGKMRDWLSGGMIDDDKELAADLPAVEYGFAMKSGRDCILLEKKEHMKKRGLASPDDGDALCFVGGTLIQTPNGLRPIEDLDIGDLVTTPFGATPVMVKWHSQTDKLTTAKFSNGSALCGKGEHKIFAWGAGIVRLDSLPLTIEVEAYSQWRLMLWRAAKGLFIGIPNITFKVAVDIFSRDTELTASGFCIAAFGLSATALFQRAYAFITKITTGAITPLITSNWWSAAHITAITCEYGKPAQVRLGYSNTILNWLGLKPLNGTALQKGLSGTDKTERLFGQIGSQLAQFAPYAPLHTGPISQHEADFVQDHVRNRRGLSVILRTLAPAIGAVRRSWRTVTGLRPVVPVSVQTESAPLTGVYNLTLEKHNAYYANGILAFNCLTFAHPVAPADQRYKYGNQVTSGHHYEYDPLAQ